MIMIGDQGVFALPEEVHMKYLKKTVSILLSFIMVFSLFTMIPFDAFAADGNAEFTDVSTRSQLQAAINASGRSHVRLAADITEQENDTAVLVGEGKTVTLDLNGFTLSRNLTENKDDGYVIRVNSGGALTVSDSSAAATGNITGGYSKNGVGIYNLGTLTLEGGKLSGNIATENGGGVYNESSVTVTGGSVINNSGKEGGGIYNCSTGVVALGGSGEVTANKSSESSGGGVANYGTLSVSDNAEISCNYGYTDGGGIINNGTVNIYDGITSLLKKQAVL